MIVPLSALAHSRSVVSVATAAVAGQITAGDVGAVLAALVALASLLLAIRGTNAKRLEDAERRGRDSRNDEIARLNSEIRAERDDKEFYRREYAGLLQSRAGAPVVSLPPSERRSPPREDD